MQSGGREVYSQGPRVAFRKIGGKFVLVNLRDNRVVRLNETGTEIWGSLDGRDLTALAVGVCRRFDARFEDALADAREFLEELRTRGLVERAE